MREVVKLGLILMIYTIIAAGALALVNSKTAPIIAENKRIASSIEAMAGILKEILPGSENFEKIPEGAEINLIKAYKGGKFFGYIFTAAGEGYQSEIKTLVGVDIGGTILGIRVIEQAETPGIGNKVMDETDWAPGQFIGKSLSNNLRVTRDGGEIEAITGATISSSAVANSVHEALIAYAEIIGLDVDIPEGPTKEGIYKEFWPDADSFEEDPAGMDIGMVRAKSGDKTIGFVIEADAKIGSKTIPLLVSVTEESYILGVRPFILIKEDDPLYVLLMGTGEPGTSWAEETFLGKYADDDFTLSDDKSKIEPLAGYEEESAAVAEALQIALIQFKYLDK